MSVIIRSTGDDALTDVYVNNLAIFTSALTPDDPAFYIFNVVGGSTNPLYDQLPHNLPQQMCIVVSSQSSDGFSERRIADVTLYGRGFALCIRVAIVRSTRHAGRRSLNLYVSYPLMRRTGMLQ